jgi:hypothetical protein
MSNLLARFTDVAEKTEQLLKDTKSVQHPQAELFRACLLEQREALNKLLPLLSAGETELEKIKAPISIIYNSNDVATPTFRAWVRAIHWMDLPEISLGKELQSLFPAMRNQLEEAAAELERLYGAEAVKYVVPSFYISTVR